jgi:hypothetical protein
VALAQQLLAPPRTGKNGRPRKAHPAPFYAVQEVRAKLPDEQWQSITWTRLEAVVQCGSSLSLFVCDLGMGTSARTLEDRRVHTGAEGWRVRFAERPLPGQEGECQSYLSHLPATKSFEQLVPFVRGRWQTRAILRGGKTGMWSQ